MADDFRIKLTEFENDLIKNEINKYKEAGKKAMKEIRESIVDEWFGEFSSLSMNTATQYTGYSTFYSSGMAKIFIHSYVDTDVYNDKPKAEKWREKWGGNMSGREYVLDLLLKQGIIGLPEKSNLRGLNWTNPNFHQQEPLEAYISGSDKWSQFESLVNKYV